MAVETENGTLVTSTAEKMITRAYRLLGDISKTESLTSDQADVGLEALNAMLDSHSIQRLNIYEVRQESLTWPSNTTSRTIGSGADFDTHRPDRIEQGTYFQDSNNIAYQVEIVRNRATYDAIYDKTVTSTYPEMLMYVPSTTWGTLYVYPVPTASITLKLNTWQPLQIFTLTEALILPAGYRRMLVYNLAVELEAEAQLPVPASVVKIAIDSLKAVKASNNLPIFSQTETSFALYGRGRADIVAGK